MSHCVVPQWNRRHQRQAHQGAEEEEGTTSPHVPTQNLNLVPMYMLRYLSPLILVLILNSPTYPSK